MALNAMKLKKVKDHLENLGSAEVSDIAALLKGKPENPGYLREFVEQAGKELNDESHLIEFDNSVKAYNASKVTPENSEEAPKPAAQTAQRPPDESEIGSKPEAEVKPAPPSGDPTPAQQRQKREERQEGKEALIESHKATLAPFSFRFRDAQGISSDLQIVHVGQNGTVVLEKKAASVHVDVTLKGQSRRLNITELKAKPGAELVNIDGTDYSAATLLMIAEHAQA